jgi:two-component sensor histidine kinase
VAGVSDNRTEASNREVELSSEIARLHELLRETAANAQAAADLVAADIATVSKTAVAIEVRQTRELADERALTAAARDDTRKGAAQAAVAAERSRQQTAARETRHARELSEERARTSAARDDARELQHRIKNTFATVQAIANATLRPDISYDDARAAFHSRLTALAQVQDLLFQKNWSNTTLKSLIESMVEPYLGSGSARLRVRGPDTKIGPKTALVFGLALNELATNALKYGALSNADGYVEVAWTRKREFQLRWHERNGPPVTAPTRNGFGSRLIRDSLTAQLRGTVEVDFNGHGLICTVRAPVHELLL